MAMRRAISPFAMIHQAMRPAFTTAKGQLSSKLLFQFESKFGQESFGIDGRCRRWCIRGKTSCEARVLAKLTLLNE